MTIMPSVRRIEGLSPDIAAYSDAFVGITSERIELLVYGGEVSPHLFHTSYKLGTPLSLMALKDFFFSTSALSLPFRSVILHYFDASPVVVVPEDLSSSTEQDFWLEHLVSLTAREPLVSPLALERVSIHYSIPQDIYDFSIRSFPLLQFVPSFNQYIPMILSYSRKTYGKVMLVARVSGVAEILYAVEGELQLCNRYRVPTDMDLKYYITALWRQAGFDVLQDHLLYFTRLTESDLSFVSELKKHIHKLQLNPYPLDHKWALDFTQDHSLLSLPPSIILQALCVL